MIEKQYTIYLLKFVRKLNGNKWYKQKISFWYASYNRGLFGKLYAFPKNFDIVGAS